MSEQVNSNNQQTIVIGLIVIAALLAAIVGVLVYQTAKAGQLPEPTVSGATQQTGATPQTSATGTAGTTGQTTMGQTQAAEFDAKTATKLPAGTTPEQWVSIYYKACETGDWQKAYDALPTSKKEGQTPEGLKEQVMGYGIKSFKITSAVTSGDKATVKADQITGQYGTFENTWTFVKKSGVWLVESKAVTGMKQ
jgi:hypothetical protein